MPTIPELMDLHYRVSNAWQLPPYVLRKLKLYKVRKLTASFLLDNIEIDLNNKYWLPYYGMWFEVKFPFPNASYQALIHEVTKKGKESGTKQFWVSFRQLQDGDSGIALMSVASQHYSNKESN